MFDRKVLKLERYSSNTLHVSLHSTLYTLQWFTPLPLWKRKNRPARQSVCLVILLIRARDVTLYTMCLRPAATISTLLLFFCCPALTFSWCHITCFPVFHISCFSCFPDMLPVCPGSKDGLQEEAEKLAVSDKKMRNYSIKRPFTLRKSCIGNTGKKRGKHQLGS